MVRKLVSKVLLIIASLAFLQIIGTILLARNLPKQDMGFYRLLLTLIDLGVILGTIGIEHSLVRFFSSASVGIEEYNWKMFIKKFLLASSLIAISISVIYAFIYKLSIPAIFFLTISITMISSILIFSSFLRAKEKYGLAIFFSRNIFLIFFILLTVIYALKCITIKNVIASYLVSAVLANMLAVSYFLKKTKNGNKIIPPSILKNGLYYFGIGVALLILLQTGNLIIGKVLSFRELAIFTVVASVMRLFEFAQDASYYVLTPHLNKSVNRSLKEIFLKLFCTGLLISLFYVIFAKPLVHFLFRGLYDEGLYLIPYFIGIGFVRTLFTLPASIIGGRSSAEALKNQLFITSLAALLNLGLSFTLINILQLKGVAIANLTSWVLLLSASLFLTRKYITPINTRE